MTLVHLGCRTVVGKKGKKNTEKKRKKKEEPRSLII